MKTIQIIIYIITALSLAACGGRDENRYPEGEKGQVESGRRDQGHADTDKNRVSLTKRQREAVGLKVGDFTEINLDGIIRVTGELELYPEDEASVGSFMEGNISRVLVKPGEKVRKGQVMAYIEDPAFIDLQSGLRELQSEYDYLKQEYGRQKKLYENKVASGKNFQRITADYTSVASRLQSARAKMRLLKTDPDAVIGGKTYQALPVVSPVNGYVSDIGVTLGQRIAAGNPLFHVINKENIHADLLVYEKDLGKIKEGQQVTMFIANDNKNPVKGEVTDIGKNYESDIRAVRMHVSLEGDKEDYVPGMYVEGNVAVENLTARGLPESAIVRDEGRSYIFLKTEREDRETAHKDNHEKHHAADREEDRWAFVRTEVITGKSSDGWVEVKISGPVPEYREVVTAGAYYLLAEMKKGETEHSH
ncbi:efflux RND transporter periplasmic adaptor subunit [Sinomicrobium soli]|uniref:efflux RND transporter periplasmic adaptor subunit n=1 Tax=Sinomicrobium sp. N-1-3-6 TaxID=2219864 RepID=UPI000DCC2E3D|nr:efflux RND transporter periplasmic adaptor subunit [Sinomicrobium sp. N-1-3-6]RAV27582.1 hypothetical protein DN748_18010 [Sinomicrobium sp. N-1-3-6]